MGNHTYLLLPHRVILLEQKMQTRTSAILLLSLGSLIPIVTSAEDGDCLIEEKIDYYGNDLEHFKNVPSQEECAKKTAEVDGAKFWTYKTKSKTCYTKKSKKGKKAHPNGVSGNVECAPAECLIEEKIDYYGNDLEHFKNVPSKEECAEKAAAVEEAKFWTYQTKSKTCFSKKSNKGPKKAHPDGVSGNVECANGQEDEDADE